jgi:phospholipid-binding lipoprotein MlaA
MQHFFYSKSVLGLALFFWLISGCATAPANKNPDPLEKFNRGVYAFNESVDKLLLKPVAETYKTIVPEPVDQGVSNFFSNIDDIVVVANDLFQFKFKQAASDSGRFLLNSTVGLLGIFDVASELGLFKHEEDFGQTLGYWGVESGPYLVLPFLGPSSTRDAVGLGTDSLFDPLFYAGSQTFDPTYAAPYVVKGVDTRADLLGVERILQVAALDQYSYIRDAYLARREYLVHDGNPPEEEIEESFDEDDDLFDDLEEGEDDLFDDLKDDSAKEDNDEPFDLFDDLKEEEKAESEEAFDLFDDLKEENNAED